MPNIKPGAQIHLLHPAFKTVFRILDYAWPMYYPTDTDGWLITSGHEGAPTDLPEPVHDIDSKHYIINCKSGFGEAVDLRLNDVLQSRAHQLAAILENVLLLVYGIRTKIFLENLLKQSAHFHVQVEL